MRNSKKKKRGREERLAVLERFFPQAAPRVCEHCMSSYRRSQLALDDVIDALVAALVGAIDGNPLTTLPSTPTRDSEGLPMEMVYLRWDGPRSNEGFAPR